MKKTLLAVVTLAFVAGPAFAAKHEAPATDKKALKAACKGKNPGDMVKVDGKDVACPDKKKKEGEAK